MHGKVIHTRKDDGVGYIEINNPKVNTYDLEMMNELDQAIEEFRFDDEAKVIVLTSAVPWCFQRRCRHRDAQTQRSRLQGHVLPPLPGDPQQVRGDS